ALAGLRTRTTAVVPDFPLGRDATAELELRRFEPFAPGARVEAVDGGGVREVKLPDHVYFTGTVRGEPDSRVLLVAARDHVRGFVAAHGTVYPFGPDRRGRHRRYALRDVDPSAYPPPGAFCACASPTSASGRRRPIPGAPPRPTSSSTRCATTGPTRPTTWTRSPGRTPWSTSSPARACRAGSPTSARCVIRATPSGCRRSTATSTSPTRRRSGTCWW